MANNFTFKDASGTTQTTASTEIAGVHRPHTILVHADGTVFDAGNTTMANSFPVTIASNQTAVPVSGTVAVSSAAVTIASGADVVQGATGDAAITTDTTGTINGKMRGLIKWAYERMPAALGQTTMTASLPVVIASNQTAVPASIASGSDIVQGATGDAAVVTDTTGTVNGKLRGLVKWAFERMPAALGQTTMTASLPVVIASNQTSVPVSGTVTIVPDITTTTVTATVTGAYAVGDCVGGKLTFTNSMGGLDGKIKSITISSSVGETFDGSIVFFEGDPSASTLTDNSPVTIPGADLQQIIAVVPFVVADFVSFSGSSATSLECEYPCDAKTCYAVVMAGTTTPDFGVGNSSLYVTIGTNDY